MTKKKKQKQTNKTNKKGSILFKSVKMIKVRRRRRCHRFRGLRRNDRILEQKRGISGKLKALVNRIASCFG